MPSYISQKLRYNSVEQFKESFSEPEPTIGYIFLAKSTPYANDLVPEEMYDNVKQEKKIWDDMIAGKKVTGNDVQLVIPLVRWTANTKYKQYDDEASISDLNTIDEYGVYPMYVMNSEGNVYKCLSNGISSQSIVEPSGQNLTNNGIIYTGDNNNPKYSYLWKYLYNISDTNKYLTYSWIPVPTSVNQNEYSVKANTIIDGELTTIKVVDAGSGYIDSNISVSTFNVACNYLVVDASVDMTNLVSTKMGVSGVGIQGDTYISDIDYVRRRIYLSYNTASTGGGTNSSNTIAITTRTEILGDSELSANGEIAYSVPHLANGSIDAIVVTNYGKGYSWANVNIYGTATGSNVANARVILPPKLGHGFNSARELDCYSVMINVKIGETDSSEGGLLSTETVFREYGLLTNPYKYGELEIVSSANANTVILQTMDLDVISGLPYETNEFVYQGDYDNPVFSGIVETQNSNIVRLTNYRGEVILGSVLKGTITNPTGRAVFSVNKYPEFEKYTGCILYGENVLPISRADGQSENIKLVVKF